MRKIITSLIAILVVTNLEAQQRTPKLVVCITVDQLRGDYIEYFYNTFGERGFKRLMNEGLVYNNIRFEFSDIDQASAFATLFTGSNPCFSGIAGDKTFDFEKEKEVSILNDPEYLGNYTKENYSPKNLFSSTIGDELKIAWSVTLPSFTLRRFSVTPFNPAAYPVKRGYCPSRATRSGISSKTSSGI